MNKNTLLFSRLAFAAGAFAGFVCFCGKVSADVAVTYSINETGLPTISRPGVTQTKYPATVKAYYTSTKARVEGLGGVVTIYDLGASQTYVLDPVKKTYYIQPVNSQSRLNGLSAPTTLQPTGETRTVKDLTADEYELDGEVDLGQFSQMAAAAGFTPPTLTGRVWFSDSVPLPNGITNALPESSIFTLGSGLFAKSLAHSVLLVKRVPISGSVTFAMNIPNNNGGPATSLNIVETFVAQSISTNDVSPDLFTVPTTYKQIDPPMQNGYGNGGQGGWNRNGGGAPGGGNPGGLNGGGGPGGGFNGGGGQGGGFNGGGGN